MNYRFVINQLGLLQLVLCAMMLLVAGWAMLDWLIGGSQPIGSEALLFTAGVGFLLGGVMWLYGRRESAAELPAAAERKILPGIIPINMILRNLKKLLRK